MTYVITVFFFVVNLVSNLIYYFEISPVTGLLYAVPLVDFVSFGPISGTTLVPISFPLSFVERIS